MADCCLQQQVTELQLIAAMYPSQLDFYDPVVSEIVAAADPVEELNAKRSLLLSDVALEFVFEQADAEPPLELHFTLPANYPSSGKLDAHLRLLDTNMTSATLKRSQLKANEQLKQYLAQTDDCNVLSVIQWVDEYREVLAREARAARDEVPEKGKRIVTSTARNADHADHTRGSKTNTIGIKSPTMSGCRTRS